MKIEVKNNCPLNNFEECKTTSCAWFTKIRGTNKNTGEDLDEWGCAVAWLPVLLIETSSQTRQTGAAVESFRNEMVQANETSRAMFLTNIQQSLPRD